MKGILLYRKCSLVRLAAEPGSFFAVTALFFGLLFMFLTPPLQGPDEQAHFAQVYRYSEGSISATSSIPRGLAETYKTIFYGDDIRFNSNEKYELGRTKHALLQIPLGQHERTEGSPYSGTGYSPITYLSQIFLVFIGRLLNLPVIVLIYLARLGSLLVFIALMYAAIRYTPVAKWPFVIVGLLPMSIFAASVVSSDAVTIGASALFIGAIINIVANRGKIPKKKFGILIGTTVLLAVTKIVNVLLLPLLILLFFKKDASNQRKQLAVFVVLTIFIGIATVAAWQFLAPEVPTDSVSNVSKNVIPGEQIRLMIESPQKFLFALWNTYFYGWGDSIFSSLIGTFGWVDTSMAAPFIIGGYILLTFALLTNRGGDMKLLAHLGRVPRIGIFLIAIIYIVGVNAAMFIYFSPVDFNIIVGVQGRYFIPLIFLLAVVSINRNRITAKEEVYKLVIRAMPVALLVVSVLYIFIRYYVNTRI